MNKKVSKISVITTLYKGNKYIEQLQKMIEKNAEILRKQYDIDVEYILVNDFPDEDVILFDERPLNYIVRVQNNEVNSGIHVSRINGIKNSDGELIFILDQDDKIEKCWLLYPLSDHWLPVLFLAETFLLSTHTAGWSRNDPADCI